MKHTGVILDIETTGLNHSEDKIIEIGLLEFSFGDGISPVITRTYSSLEDPGCELSAEITGITGLTTDQLRGQKIDWAQVRSLMAPAGVVIAHNARFEKKFLRLRPELEGLVDRLFWACSAQHIDWAAHGHKTRALNYLAADKGFLNPFPHRAVFDCMTTFKVISGHLPELLSRAKERDILFKAVGSPFERKDVLKARGYLWNAGERVWSKVVKESDLENERAFLAESVYSGASRHTEQVEAA